MRPSSSSSTKNSRASLYDSLEGSNGFEAAVVMELDLRQMSFLGDEAACLERNFPLNTIIVQLAEGYFQANYTDLYNKV
jgi:hypothetical protein